MRACCRGVSRSAPVWRVRRARYRGSWARPRLAVQFLLDAAPALVEGVPSEPHDVERIHDRGRLREFFGGGGLEAGEPIHRDDLHRRAPRLGSAGEATS